VPALCRGHGRVSRRAAKRLAQSNVRELTSDEMSSVAGGNIMLTMITQLLEMQHEAKKAVIQNLRA